MPVIKKIYHKDAKIGIWKLSEEVHELEKIILNNLSDEEKIKYTSFKSVQRKKEWLATRILLKQIKESPFHTIISYNEACKPYTKFENISISHSRDYVVIIISNTENVSIDVEKISSKPFKIKHKFLSEEEQKYFDVQKPEIATLLWSAKETVYKYHSKKQLAFIDKITILETKVQETGVLNTILLNSKLLKINYLFEENNVLTYIVE